MDSWALGGTQQASVGALGWLGFLIINSAAWGLVAASSSISWVLGFVVCLAYTGVLFMYARYMENMDDGAGKIRYHRFLNLLWVLICTFVFIDGTFLALKVFGDFGSNPAQASEPDLPPRPAFGKPSLPELLPGDAAAGLKSWAETASIHWSDTGPSFAKFQDNLYIPGNEVGTEEDNLVVAKKGTLDTSDVVSGSGESLYRARGFQFVGSKLFFFADTEKDRTWSRDTEAVWSVEGDAPSVAARTFSKEDLAHRAVTGNLSSSPNLQWSAAFHDDASGSFYIVAQYFCHSVLAEYPDCGIRGENGLADVYTIIKSDGSNATTVDLRGDVCTDVCKAEAKAWEEFDGVPSFASGQRMELWCTFFLAVIPMMYVAATVIWQKAIPGPSFNLWLGGQIAGIVLYMLVGHHIEDVVTALENKTPIPGQTWGFEQWFVTLFNAGGYGLLVLWSLSPFSWRSSWKEELKMWLTFFFGWASFVMIHVNLRLPSQEGEGLTLRWTAYAVLTGVQFALAIVLRDQTPMLAGAGCLFVLSWKVAYEVVDVASFIGEEWKLIALMLIMAFEGIGIIVGAMTFSSVIGTRAAEADKED